VKREFISEKWMFLVRLSDFTRQKSQFPNPSNNISGWKSQLFSRFIDIFDEKWQ